VDLCTVELDVLSESSIPAAVDMVIGVREGRIDTLIHNAGHMAYGPAKTFTTQQFMHLYDINCVGMQRNNKIVLPHMRRAGQGLLVWVSSSSARGPNSLFLAPYFAAKAAMDSLAQTYADELTRWGIETSIVLPGNFTKGANHFATGGTPTDKDVVKQ
jgi:NAD(P)-dependent dehydrogenase (short-subunit alcohol dehydrogenase family)